MTNGLISVKDAKREEFNFLPLSVNNVSQFLAYYTLVLTAAYEYQLINEKEAKKISNLLLNTFKETFKFDTLIMSNNMYVLTLFLKSMDNITQLETLLKVSTSKDATDLFNTANIWFIKKIKFLKCKLLNLKPKVIKIQSQILADSFEELLSDLNELSTFSSSKTTCNLKNLHNTLIILRYPLLGANACSLENENYLSRLQNVINSFAKEVCILYKLNPKEIIANLEESSKENLNSSIYDNMHDESKILFALEDLEEEYQKKLREAENSADLLDFALHQLELADRKTFKNMHPELTGDAFEEAFEDWQFSLPDDHFEVEAKLIDEDEIKAEYRKKRELLLEELEKLEEKHAKKVLEHNASQKIDLSLELILKAMAMLELFKINPNMHIPETNLELLNALENFPFPAALEIITKTIKPNLSKSEFSYLKGN